MVRARTNPGTYSNAGKEAGRRRTISLALAVIAVMLSLVSTAISGLRLRKARAFSLQMSQLANRPSLDVVSMRLVDPSIRT